jgi:hypothetical protein
LTKPHIAERYALRDGVHAYERVGSVNGKIVLQMVYRMGRVDMTALHSRAERVPTWPPLPLASWFASAATLHMWTQIVGKIRLALSPHVNHWWQVPLHVSARGLSTSAIPYGGRLFEMEFDFLGHSLEIRESNRATKYVPLFGRSVADFYRELMAVLHSISIDVKIWPKPVEIADPLPFADDTVHASYEPEAVGKFHRILMTVDAVFKQFRGGFGRKSQPGTFLLGQL